MRQRARVCYAIDSAGNRSPAICGCWPEFSTASRQAVSPDSAEEELVAVKCSVCVCLCVAPAQPSQDERDAHEANHLPYRSWCRHCVRGKGKSDAHKQLDAEKQHSVPTVSMDYCFMGHDDDDKTLPVLRVRDHRHKVTYSHVAPSKCTKHPYSVSQVVHDIDQLGYSKLICRMIRNLQ